MTNDVVRWLRFLPRTALQYAANHQALMVFVPVQPWHFSELGVASQAMLSGPGEVDSKVVTVETSLRNWSQQMALEYCESSLRGLVKVGPKHIGSGENQYMLSEVEGLEHKVYGRQQVLHSGLISQELLIPEAIWSAMLSDAEHDTMLFHLLKLIGLHLLETQTIDMQPRVFRNWFAGVVCGITKPPGKKPKSIALFQRHRMIIALVRRLRMQGIHPTTSSPSGHGVSGCGIVASAVANVGLTQPRSYEGVRKIWANRPTH